MIQPMDSVVQVIAGIVSGADAATCNGEGVARVEHVAAGHLILHLVEALDITGPDPGFAVIATPSTPANVLEITVFDELRIRVRMSNPATAALRAGSAWIMVLKRHLPAVESV